MLFAVVASSPATNSTRPMPSVSSRHADGGGAEVRRLTPSGEIRDGEDLARGHLHVGSA
jgi:hypothetical protein